MGWLTECWLMKGWLTDPGVVPATAAQAGRDGEDERSQQDGRRRCDADSR
jgi:hypothetical protein